MPLFLNRATPEQLAATSKRTMVESLGIEFVEVGDEHLVARMPVDHRTHQPYGILHGGASVALAETLGSIASALCVDPEVSRVVGLEINANHIRPVREGWVVGTCRPVHIGRSTHVWETRITNEDGKLTCISRLTVSVIPAAALAGRAG